MPTMRSSSRTKTAQSEDKSEPSDSTLKEKVSDGMSKEGKIAMEMAKQDMRWDLSAQEESDANSSGYVSESTGNSQSMCEVKIPKRIRFLDVYEKESIPRLTGDITGDTTRRDVSKRRSLSGENLASAMEIVETVVYGEDDTSLEADERAIEETAKMNSLEKCVVWMVVNSQDSHDGS